MLGRDGQEGSSAATSERRPLAAPRARVGASLNTAVAQVTACRVRPRYDGQFFYRLALAPADLRLEAQGVRLDTALRRQRPGYPALAWLLSCGRPTLVAWALLVVNVLGLGVLGLLGGLAAQDAGRHALTLGELHVTGALALLGDPRRRLAVPAVALSAGWLTTAAFRALVV
jgi:hypothetical protein